MRHYTLKSFLQSAANEALDESFKRDGLLSDINFSKLTPGKIEPVFEAIQQLPKDARAKVDTDFQDIFALDYEGGMRLLIEEGRYNNIDFVTAFSTLKGHHAKAFWVFLNYKTIFNAALPFTCRENLKGNWRKRRGLPEQHNVDFSKQKDQFATAVGNHFKNEGRGRTCKMDYSNRGRFHYFFAYPEEGRSA